MNVMERLQTKIGPLPVWAWGGIGAAVVWFVIGRGGTKAGDSSLGSQYDGGANGGGGDPGGGSGGGGGGPGGPPDPILPAPPDIPPIIVTPGTNPSPVMPGPQPEPPHPTAPTNPVTDPGPEPPGPQPEPPHPPAPTHPVTDPELSTTPTATYHASGVSSSMTGPTPPEIQVPDIITHF